jgi:serine/threonine protein kinase
MAAMQGSTPAGSMRKVPPLASIPPLPLDRLFVGRGAVPSEFLDLLGWLLQYDPKKRPTAYGVCSHPYFDELRAPEVRRYATLAPCWRLSARYCSFPPDLSPGPTSLSSCSLMEAQSRLFSTSLSRNSQQSRRSCGAASFRLMLEAPPTSHGWTGQGLQQPAPHKCRLLRLRGSQWLRSLQRLDCGPTTTTAWQPHWRSSKEPYCPHTQLEHP